MVSPSILRDQLDGTEAVRGLRTDACDLDESHEGGEEVTARTLRGTREGDTDGADEAGLPCRAGYRAEHDLRDALTEQFPVHPTRP